MDFELTVFLVTAALLLICVLTIAGLVLGSKAFEQLAALVGQLVALAEKIIVPAEQVEPAAQVEQVEPAGQVEQVDPEAPASWPPGRAK